MKWLLILFVGIIFFPVLAQNTPINQTEYQKLGNSISGLQINLQQLNTSVNGLQIDHQKLGNSINEVHHELKNNYQNLGGNINGTRADSYNYYIWSLCASGAFTAIAFLGGVATATILDRRQRYEQGEIKNLISKVEQISNRQNEVAQEIREDVSHGLTTKLELVILNLDQCIHLFELRNQETDPTLRLNFMRSMTDEYDRCYGFLNLEINLIELMRIFGRATARQYWTLVSFLGINSNIYVQSDDDLQSFIGHVNECLGRCLDLYEAILPQSSDQVRSQSE